MTLSKLEQNAAATKRWRTRLKRAMTALDKLDRQRKRLLKAASNDLAVAPPLATAVKPKPVEHPYGFPGSHLPPEPESPDAIDTSIPTFLQRKKLDPVAEQIEREQTETKKRKAQGRIAKMKAKQSGATKAMPLTGKAALAAIRG